MTKKGTFTNPQKAAKILFKFNRHFYPSGHHFSLFDTGSELPVFQRRQCTVIKNPYGSDSTTSILAVFPSIPIRQRTTTLPVIPSFFASVGYFIGI